jgi:hypothetical protein
VLGAVLLGAPPGVVAPAEPGEVGRGVWLEVVALGVPVAERAGVVGPRPPGENDGGVVDGEPDEQADTDTGTNIARTAQPSTVRRRRLRP